MAQFWSTFLKWMDNLQTLQFTGPASIDMSTSTGVFKGPLGGVINNGGSQTPVVVLTPGATVSLDPTKGGTFTLVPAQAETINAASVPTNSQRISIVITTSGTTSYVVTFGTNFKSTGTLTTGTVSGKVFVIDFVSDGTNFNEIARTVAM